jgi:arylsulfatase A-like enzyme
VKEAKGRNRIMGASIDYTKPFTFGPNQVGFDYFYGITASLDMPPYVFLENDHTEVVPTEIMFSSSDVATDHGRRGYGDPNFVLEEVLPILTQKAVNFIEQQDKKTPFFLYFPMNSPHTPIVPTAQFRGKSGAGIYGDFVLETDWSIGELVAALKRKGLYKNTIIVVTSDNGTSPHSFPIDRELKYHHNTSNNFKGRKSHSYEGGHRVPFIVTWPAAIKAGTTSDEVVCSTDFFATLAELMHHKLKKTEGVDSYSILPVLLGKKLNDPLREATVHHSLSGMFSIRKGKWKYIDGKGHGGFGGRLIKEEFSTEPQQLYNMETDPYETKNIYKQHPEIVAELKALLEKYKAQGYSRSM